MWSQTASLAAFHAAVSLTAGGAYAFLTNALIATPCTECFERPECDVCNSYYGCAGCPEVPMPDICPSCDASFRKPIFATLMIFAIQGIFNMFLYAVMHYEKRHGCIRTCVNHIMHDDDKQPPADSDTVKLSQTKEATSDWYSQNITSDDSAQVATIEMTTVPAAAHSEVASANDNGVTSTTAPADNTTSINATTTDTASTTITTTTTSAAATHAEMTTREIFFTFPIVIITALDVGTVALQAGASLYIPASINAAMRGALLLVVGLISRALHIGDGHAGKKEWLGIAVSTLGASAIGGMHIIATAQGNEFGDTSVGDAVFGVLLSLLSNVSLATGIVYETKVFERKKPAPLLLNIARCSYATVALLIFMMVLNQTESERDHGRLENSSHTLCCLSHNPRIAFIAVWIGLCAGFSGITALYLSKLIGSNFRALIYVGRAFFVWLLQMLVFYAGSAMHDYFSLLYGKRVTVFTGPQALAFVLLAIGGYITLKGRSQRLAQQQPQS